MIPHSVIETKLKEYDVTPQSNILFVKAALNDPKYLHILSFRRQFYAKQEDVENKIPESSSVNYEGTDYWIYVSSGNLTCFLSKETGHIARNCRSVGNEDQSIIITPSENNETNMDANTQDINNVPMNEQTAGNKRTRSQVSNERDDIQIVEENKDNTNTITHSQSNTDLFIKPKANTSKRNTKQQSQQEKFDCETLLQPAKEHITNSSAINPLSYDQLEEFMNTSHRNREPIELSKEYTEDTMSLIKMMSSVYHYVENRSIKSRITGLIERLQNTDDATSTE